MSDLATIRAKRRTLGLPHWRPSQRRRMQECIAAGCTIAYWNSDAHGQPANHGVRVEPARPGLVLEVAGPLMLCSPQALHATMQPHRWRGSRVWIVALHGRVEHDGDVKCGALKREILGEVLPEESWVNPSVAARLGVVSADLSGADLSGADLSGANLSGAYLSGAYLSGADLSRADLSRADLSGADLSGAYLSGAYLSGADLSGADLSGADLSRADLSGANLSGANLSGAYRGTISAPIAGWRTLATGYVERDA